ncbi:MAG: hypothetical protein IJ295_00380 [Clostridia bacterium]|nr:hypothetical protein [Clostridia bacterium]
MENKLKSLNNNMKDNIINVAKKWKGKMLPTIFMALMLGSSIPAKALPTATNKETSNNYKTPVYQTASNGYNDQSIQNISNQILISNLMAERKLSDKESEKEMVNLLTAANYNLLDLSLQYKSLGKYNQEKSGLSPEEINSIITNNFNGVSTEKAAKALSVAIPYTVTMALDTLTLIRNGADQAYIAAIDPVNNYSKGTNEFYTSLEIKRIGKRNLINEANAALDALEIEIAKVLEYKEVKNHEKFISYLAHIKALVSNKSFAQNRDNFTKLSVYKEQLAELLPEDEFGTLPLRKALIEGVFTSQYALSYILEKFEKEHPNFELGTVLTNQQFGIQTSAVWDKPVNNNNWGYSLGAELNAGLGFNQNNYVQALGTAGIGYTTEKGNKISLNTKAGIQLDNQGSNPIALGAETKYTWPINKNLSIDASAGGMYTKESLNGRVGISAAYRTPKVLLKFFVGIEGNKNLSHGQTTTKPTPVPPSIYGEEDVEIQQGNGTTNENTNGYGSNEKPVDLSKY